MLEIGQQEDSTAPYKNYSMQPSKEVWTITQ